MFRSELDAIAEARGATIHYVVGSRGGRLEELGEPRGGGVRAPHPAEPAGRRVLRTGFGLLWVFDGILQAQPRMPGGPPSQVIEPTAQNSPRWVQDLVNAGGTIWSEARQAELVGIVAARKA